MKKITFTILLIGLSLLIYRCSGLKKTASANKITNEKILLEAQKKSSTVTLANITNGESIYNNKCFKCHGAKGGIKGHSSSDWVKIIDSMAKKAKLTEEEKSNLSFFILGKKELLNVQAK